MIEIHFLPYGRVDAILIGVGAAPESKVQPSAIYPEEILACPEKSANLSWHWAFVDGGYRRDGVKAVKYMREIGIERLDAYIATHRHRNHVGAAPVVIKEMQPRQVYTADGRMQARLSALCSGAAERFWVDQTEHVVMQPGDVFCLGGASLHCLAPEKMNKYAVGAVGENYNSLILWLEYMGRSVLLTGDTSAGVLGKIPDRLLKAEVLKNPHHNGALGEKLLKKIGPKFTVICNGKPPAKYYRQRLKSVGSKLFTAGKNGDGLVILEGNEMGWRRRDNGGET